MAPQKTRPSVKQLRGSFPSAVNLMGKGGQLLGCFEKTKASRDIDCNFELKRRKWGPTMAPSAQRFGPGCPTATTVAGGGINRSDVVTQNEPQLVATPARLATSTPEASLPYHCGPLRWTTCGPRGPTFFTGDFWHPSGRPTGGPVAVLLKIRAMNVQHTVQGVGSRAGRGGRAARATTRPRIDHRADVAEVRCRARA